MPDIFELSSTIVDELIELDPTIATYLGAPGHDHRWNDTSPSGFDEFRAYWVSVADRANACDTPTRRDQVAKAVLLAEAEQEITAIDAGRHLSDLNNIASPWQGIRNTFDLMPDDTVVAWLNIVERLRTITEPLAGYRACLTKGLERGDLAAARQVAAAIEQGRAAAGDESSFTVLLERFDSADLESADLEKPELRSTLVEAIESAKRAYGAMTDWLETTYLPLAPEADGVGRDRYVLAAQQFLGESIDPEAVHAWGWSELDRLTQRLAELCARIDPDATTSTVMERLATDPAFGVDGVEQFLAVMLERQQAALRELDGTHFDVPDPVRQIEVKAAPPGGALAASYGAPSEDFSRPGCVWYPIGGRTFFPLFDEITTAYHEGFPGHHLQIGWQTAMGDELSRFHRLLVWYPGSGEGWALYAEHLMGELGYLEEPAYEIGLVTTQLLRTARIVIDIGWHCGFTIPDDQPFHPGEAWTFELATEMLRDRAYTTPDMADSEATRYAGWPGQAISYKVGERAILDLREELSTQDDFDLKQFHADLLSVGSIGLDLMRDLMRTR